LAIHESPAAAQAQAKAGLTKAVRPELPADRLAQVLAVAELREDLLVQAEALELVRVRALALMLGAPQEAQC
jgi:hypothetical protein